MHHTHTTHTYLLILLASRLSRVSADCLSEVRVEEISSYQANISWSYNTAVCGQDHLDGFKIYYDLIEYKACKNRAMKDKKKKGLNKTWREKIWPHERSKVVGSLDSGKGLLPYSVYKFTVVALRKAENARSHEKKSVRGTTEESLPTVELRPWEILRADENSVRFRLEPDWRYNHCEELNTEPGKILYEVHGLNSWNVDYKSEGEVSLETKDITITDLQPFSQYGVKLYVSDLTGRFDSRVGGEFISVKTGPGEPQPPVQIAVKGEQSARRLVWSDHYPPTGEVSSYQLSWQGEDGKWVDPVTLPLTSSGQHSVSLQDYNIPSQTSLRLRTFIEGGRGSEWSAPISEATGEMQTIVVVIVSFVLIIITFTAVFLVVRKFNLIKKYKGFERAKTDDQSSIIRESKSTKIKITSSTTRQISNNTNGSSSPVVMRPPTSNRSSISLGRSSKSRSVQDPLPPVPGEPFYEELKRPGPIEDEDGYMVPKMASMESLDDEGYLKPNFNRFQPLDTRLTSTGTPPPIPMVSYSSQDQLEVEKTTTDC